MFSDLGKRWGTRQSFPLDVMFGLQGVNRKVRRWKEAVCIRQTKVHAKALRQGRAWNFGGTVHISVWQEYNIPGVRYRDR